MLASVRTTTTVRPPFYFFGDSLGLLGLGEGRQRETIEASLVFEEEEEEAFEEKEGVKVLKTKDEDVIFVRKDEAKASKEELAEEAKVLCERGEKELGEGCNGAEKVEARSAARSPRSARCSSGQIISTNSLLSPTLPPLPPPRIVQTNDQPSPLPTKNEEPSLQLSTIRSRPHVPSPPPSPSPPPPPPPSPPPPPPPPAESGDSLTREQIIQLYTSSNSTDQSSV